MQILINNYDGKGDIDYTFAATLDKGALLVRKLNEPAALRFSCVLLEGVVAPESCARVTLKNVAGEILFGGYIYNEPTLGFLGSGADGPQCVITVTAFSDDAVLDGNPFQMTSGMLDMPAQQAWEMLLKASSNSELQLLVSDQIPNSGNLIIHVGAKWSEAAKALASSTRSTYRFIDRKLQVAPVAQRTHAVGFDDPGLQMHPTEKTDLRWASDIVIAGNIEPQVYVNEIFEGDGSTSNFQLSRPAFHLAANDKREITDLFQGALLDYRMWSITDPGSYISLTSEGLTCTGGPGRSGGSAVSSDTQVELGGTVLLEARGVCIKTGSSGQLLGLYVDSVETEKCFAAFHVSSDDTGTIAQPMVNGLTCGTSIRLDSGRLYTFRIRVNLPDMQRVQQGYVYTSTPESGMYGGISNVSTGALLFDVQDATTGALSVPANLFSGTLNSIPATCILGLVNNVNLTCSIMAMQYAQSGPLEVSVNVSGSIIEQQAGNTSEGAKCRLTATNQIVFNSDSVPAPGALVCIAYRTSGRSAARRQVANVEPSSMKKNLWMGSIIQPSARSTSDCDNAALAMLQIADDKWSISKGTYTASLLSGDLDMWPGDAVRIGPMPDGSYATSIIRDVQMSMAASDPERIHYIVQFAGDLAENLSIAVLQAVPRDFIFPSNPNDISSSLESLSRLKVTSISSGTVQILAGVEAPASGGFEVRRRDHTFGPETNSDLVLRANTSSFTITRLAAAEEYFIRMYDHNSPPNYSLFSAAVFINVPR